MSSLLRSIRRLLSADRVALSIIVLAAIIGAYRLVTLPSPVSQGENDRSRWLTIRALGDNGTYVIGKRQKNGSSYTDTGIMKEHGGKIVDKVLDPNRLFFFSSKPPLLPTILAGEYLLLHHTFGWSITRQARLVMTTILFTVNWLPMVLSMFVFERILLRISKNKWSLRFGLAAACFGTLMTTFFTTLNNHTVGAWSLIFLLYPLLRIWKDHDLSPRWFLLAGFFGGWLITNELPSALCIGALFLFILRRHPKQTLQLFFPALLIPLMGLSITNMLSVGTIIPVYEKVNTVWYLYSGSYWLHPTGIDALSDPLSVSVFHMLAGHHGFFSVSPVLLVGLYGIWEVYEHKKGLLYDLALLTIFTSLSLLIFYVLKTNNYGGISAGMRWAIWCMPLWLLFVVPGAEGLSRRPGGKYLCYALLALSVYGTFYHFYNPWQNPWVYPFFGN